MLGAGTSELAFSQMLQPYEDRSEFWAKWRLLNWVPTRADMVACNFGIRPIFGTHINQRAFRRSACIDDKGEAQNDKEVRLFNSRLTYLLKSVRSDELIPILILQDSPALRGQDPFGANMQFMRDLIADVASQLDIGLIDMAKTTKSSPDYFVDDLHMNAEGNRLRADAIRQYLVAQLIIE